jgi:hypothetical protein
VFTFCMDVTVIGKKLRILCMEIEKELCFSEKCLKWLLLNISHL